MGTLRCRWRERSTISNADSRTLSLTQVIDGIHTTTGTRLLVKDQATETENRLYMRSVVKNGAACRSASRMDSAVQPKPLEHAQFVDHVCHHLAIEIVGLKRMAVQLE